MVDCNGLIDHPLPVAVRLIEGDFLRGRFCFVTAGKGSLAGLLGRVSAVSAPDASQLRVIDLYRCSVSVNRTCCFCTAGVV